VDLIVIGHRGKTFLQRRLLGLVTKRVISYAHCVVLVVR
jgi:nucleotide-binding universal stress UspA family protein